MNHWTVLGQTLGSLAFGGDGSSKNKGYMEGMRAKALEANAEQSLAQAAKAAAETDLLNRRSELGSDTGLRNTAEIAAGTDNDLARAITQNLRRENVPLDSLPGGDAQNFYPGYKEAKQNERAVIADLMAGLTAGDKSVDLQKSIKGVTENALNSQLRNPGANVGAIANALSAFKGDADDTQKGIALQAHREKPGVSPLEAALAAFGKDMLGDRKNHEMQSKDRRYNTDVDASSSRYSTNVGASTSRANNADTLRGAMDRHNTPGAKTGAEIGRARDDVRAQYNAEFPVGMTGTRPKGAPGFADYEKNWLKTYGVDEGAYYGTPKTAPAGQSQKPGYQNYLRAFNAAKGNPTLQKQLTDLARKNGDIK